jgi:hypothetical protein
MRCELSSSGFLLAVLGEEAVQGQTPSPAQKLNAFGENVDGNSADKRIENG